MGRSGSASGTGSASVTTCVISASTLANRRVNEGRMNVAALAIPLTGLFTCANLCAAATACRPCFVLNTSTSGQPLFAGDSGLFLIVFTHGSGFPLAHTARTPQAFCVFEPTSLSSSLAFLAALVCRGLSMPSHDGLLFAHVIRTFH